MKKLFLPTILFLLALIPRLYWARDFDGLYGQDAFAYYNFAISLRESLLHFQAPEAFFWPLGYPLMLIFAFVAGGTSAFSAQILSILLGSLLAPFLYFLAREMGMGQAGAFLAGLLMSFCGQAVQSSIVVMSDIPALFWAILSAFLLWRYLSIEKSNWLIAAMLCLGLAIITRWIYLALLPVWGVLLLHHWRGIRWKLSLYSVIALLLFLLPQALYSINSPFPVLNHEWVVSWSPAHFLQQDFVNGDGRFYYASSNLTFYTAPFYQPYYLAAPFLSLIILGIVSQTKLSNLLFLAGWGIIPLVFLLGIPYQNIRFGLILFPVAALLVGAGANWVMRWRFRIIWAIILGAIIGYSLSQTLIVSHTTIAQFVKRQNQDATIVAWADRMIPSGSVVYSFGLTLRLQQIEDISVYDLFNETPESLDAKWLRGQNDYLLVNVWEIQNQWEGRSPYITFHWLFDNRGLLILGRNGNYVLCLIRG